MKVVVFGATGAIGAALVTVLTPGHDITAVSALVRGEPGRARRALGARRRE
jgi:nucleoside-diphosphate-sugar epimerase